MMKKIIGVISDTHGLLRPEVIECLSKSNLIMHVGDIGKESVLKDLKKIAPVIAVKGNCDQEGWGKELPMTEMVEVGGKHIYIIHDIKQLDIDPEAVGLSLVIFGHSHKPSIERKQNIYYLNPGSCGPRRFKLPVSFAVIKIEGKEIQMEIIELKIK